MRWTEKQNETWLEPTCRDIVNAGGRSIELEQSALFWKYFDALREKGQFPEAELIWIGRDTEEEFRLPFPLERPQPRTTPTESAKFDNIDQGLYNRRRNDTMERRIHRRV